jgi:glycogen debranching enzyme
VANVIQIDNQFYLLATSSLADDRSRVLKYGKTFGVFNRFGDIESLGLGEQGVYCDGTRYLSRFVMKLGGESPQLLRSTIRDDNAFLTVDAMNVDLPDGGSVDVERGSLHLFRSKFLRESVCYDHIRLSNYSLERVETYIVCEFEADYRDIFEVRGTHRDERGECRPAEVHDGTVVFCYQGLDDVVRRTRIAFSVRPVRMDDRRARFDFSLAPKEDFSLYITTSCEQGEERGSVTIMGFDEALHDSIAEIENGGLTRSRIVGSEPRFNAWIARSASDLQMMMIGNPEGAYPYAGVPWFSTVFGRDGILTATECLWIDPTIAKCVLKYLSETQATEHNAEQDAEPGKIIHEMRGGEMAALKEVPFGRYYGSIDSTPLFIMLAGAYLERTGDTEFLRGIWPNVLAALHWIDRYGDVDGDGFVEYQKKSARGLIQQGWKDSHDAIFYADGRIAEPPIALCEVQGYTYAARKAGARLATALGDALLAEQLLRQAEDLKTKFNRDFWDERLGTFALALDGDKRKCLVKSSNPGHCLFSGIVNVELASRVADGLLGDELFSGWGIRTLGSGEVRYNPMSYHNGSSWPHDNAIAALGLARYGFYNHAAKVFSAAMDVSELVELRRLPELFCGFHRRSHSEGPTLYPVACSPQAWAAGAVYMFLEASLGISFVPAQRLIRIEGQFLPEFVREMTITNLRLRDASCDIRIEQLSSSLYVDIIRQSGDISIASGPKQQQ